MPQQSTTARSCWPQEPMQRRQGTVRRGHYLCTQKSGPMSVRGTYGFDQECEDSWINPDDTTSRNAVSELLSFIVLEVLEEENIPKAKYCREDYWNCGVMVSYYCDSTICRMLSYLSNEPAEAGVLA